MPNSSASLNQKELQKLVESISLAFFARPFTHQVKINRRFKTTGGRYHLDDHHLEINAHFLSERYRAELIGIIKHELCHYHLHLAHRGYRHCDQDFKDLLKEVGGSRYAPDIGLRRKRKFHYLYRCQSCGQIYPRTKRLNLERYRCGRCYGQLILLESK